MEYPNGWTKFLNISQNWTEDANYLERVSKLVDFFDVAKEEVAKNKNLQSFLKKHKYIYPDLMALRVGLMARVVYVDFLYKNFACETEPLQRYIKNRQEFLSYTKNISFKKFNQHEKQMWESLVDYQGNSLIEYILFKKCNIDEKDLIFINPLDLEWDIKSMNILKTKQILKKLK